VRVKCDGTGLASWPVLVLGINVAYIKLVIIGYVMWVKEEKKIHKGRKKFSEKRIILNGWRFSSCAFSRKGKQIPMYLFCLFKGGFQCMFCVLFLRKGS
jgi:hypothetical protein